MSFSVRIKHCLSCSWAKLSEQDRQSPPKPISSSISFNMPVDPSAVANFGFDVNVWSRACADSSVAEFWQWSSMSSRIEMMGPHLVEGGELVSLAYNAPILEVCAYRCITTAGRTVANSSSHCRLLLCTASSRYWKSTSSMAVLRRRSLSFMAVRSCAGRG